jgi:hypothetical protein
MPNMKHWAIEDIQWDKFDPKLVDKKLLPVIKTASVVEHNGRHYVDYLNNIFADDVEFKEDALYWGDEEVQHGVALGKWAEMADPSFNFQKAFDDFADGYKLPLNTTKSVRGTKSGELIARCIVETGTSSLYTALAEATDEPVLKQICYNIAADEFRHYKLFYTYLKSYLEKEPLSKFQKTRIALKRITEASDDELSYAYYASNSIEGKYNRKLCNKEYIRQTIQLYKPQHIERLVSMVLKAIGYKPQGKIKKITAFFLIKWMGFKQNSA